MSLEISDRPRSGQEQPLGVMTLEMLRDTRQSLRWAWRVLWQGKGIILGCWLIAIIPTFLELKQTTPLYTAETKLVIEAPEASDPLQGRGDFRPSWLTESMVMTEVGIMTSNLLAERVVRELGLDQDVEFNAKLRKKSEFQGFLNSLNPLPWVDAIVSPNSKGTGSALSEQAAQTAEQAAVVEAFLRRLDAQLTRRSYIISISFTSNNREKAAKIANKVADLYVLDRLEASFNDAKRVTSWLAERLQSLQRDVQIAETAAEDYRARNGLRRKGEGQATINEQQLSELNSRLVIARTELAQKRARLDQIRLLAKSEGGISSSFDALQSPLIQRMREQETTLVRDMSEALKIYGERHPRLIAYRADLEQLRLKIDSEMQKISQSIANEVNVSAAGVKTLERELAALGDQTNLAGGAEVKLRELERQAEATRGLYEAFLQRFRRDTESSDSVKRANARVISIANVPAAPSYPHSSRVLLVMSMMALGLGVVIVFLLDTLDNAIRSSDEAEDIAGIPTLAVLPTFRGTTEKMVEELTQNPRSGIADALRNLRVTLDLAAEGDGKPAKIVALTSSIPKEGKTFASLCLAVMCARSGQRVLLIDGDIHRPRLHAMLGLQNDRGLLQLLQHEATPDEVIVANVTKGLDFLSAGAAENVADQIREPEVTPLFKDLTARYDRIILDLPPVLAVSDARLLASLADRVIYLVRWNATNRDAVRNGIKQLREAKAPLHGVVLSQVNQRKHARYGYGDYGTYYGRYREYYAKGS